MDPRLAYWSAALVVMATAIACAVAGWREIRHGRVERHRRLMNTAVVLVLVFVASYLVKVVVLGREELERWSAAAVAVLRVHETFVLVMVLAGTAARLVARRFEPPRVARRRHRLAGRVAVVAGICGMLTAALVLLGMYVRAASDNL